MIALPTVLLLFSKNLALMLLVIGIRSVKALVPNRFSELSMPNQPLSSKTSSCKGQPIFAQIDFIGSSIERRRGSGVVIIMVVEYFSGIL
jgi:hypothetical protein